LFPLSLHDALPISAASDDSFRFRCVVSLAEKTHESSIHMPDVFDSSDNFLPDITSLVITDALFAKLRKSGRLVNIHSIYRDSGFRPNDVPCRFIAGLRTIRDNFL